MHADNVLAVCAVLTLVGGLALALIQVGGLAREIMLLKDGLERLEREAAIDHDRLKDDLRREIDGIHREMSDIRGANAIRGRIK